MTNALIPVPGDALRVIACPRPFAIERVDGTIAAGKRLDRIVRESLGERMLSLTDAHVTIGDQVIPRGLWHLVTPKPGNVITIRAVPLGGGGGGGKNPLRMILTIAVIAAAFVFGGTLGESIVGATAFTVFGTTVASAALGQALIPIGGTLTVNMIKAPR